MNNKLKNKLRKYCEDIFFFEDDNEWCFFYDENENDEESVYIQSKVKILIEKLNNGELKYLNMDIENEIYDILCNDITIAHDIELVM